MTENEMRLRTKRFALRVMSLADSLPQTRSGNVVAHQLLRCGTSVGANYRAACRARSLADFVSKLGIVEEEADECGYWMELVVDGGLMADKRVSALAKEADEILRIVSASRITAKRNSETRYSTNRKSQIANRKSR